MFLLKSCNCKTRTMSSRMHPLSHKHEYNEHWHVDSGQKKKNKKKKKQRKGKLLTLRLFSQIQKISPKLGSFLRRYLSTGVWDRQELFPNSRKEEDSKACHGVHAASLLPLQRDNLVSSPFLAELGWPPKHPSQCAFTTDCVSLEKSTHIFLSCPGDLSVDLSGCPPQSLQPDGPKNLLLQTPASPPWAAWLTLSSWEARHLATAPGSKAGWFLFQFLHVSEPRFFVDKKIPGLGNVRTK